MLSILIIILFIDSNQLINQDENQHAINLQDTPPNCIFNKIYSKDVFSSSVICFKKCKFYSIISPGWNGGALIVHLTTAYNLTNYIIDCVFEKCHTKDAGAMFFQSVVKGSNLVINNTYYKDNSAELQGGAVSILGTNYSIINCNFEGNFLFDKREESFGGSIYLSNTNGTIEKSTFSNNFVHVTYDQAATIYSYGGAASFKNSSVIFNNCTFKNNTAYATPYKVMSRSNGGGIYFYRTEGELTNCYFLNNCGTGNSTYKPTLSNGGSIYSVYSLLSFNECHFFNNSIQVIGKSFEYVGSMQGGAIYGYYSNVTLYKCPFENNFALAIATESINSLNILGGALYLNGIKVIKDCEFINNSIYLLTKKHWNNQIYGGAIFSTSNMTCTNCKFINQTLFMNSSKYYVVGGSIHTNLLGNIIENCLFLDSSAIAGDNSGSSYGGAISICNGTIKNCVFLNCIAKHGADIYFKLLCDVYNLSKNSDNAVIVSNCIFQETKSRDFLMDSPFFHTSPCNSTKPIVFTNNSVLVIHSNISKILLFGGFKNINTIVHSIFRHNCIWPYDDSFFSNTTSLLDENGLKNVTFYDAFDSICALPTKEFTSSLIFTYSNIFSKSSPFTKSSIFTCSKTFTNSRPFTKSNIFTQSNSFALTKTKPFTFSNPFTNSNPFTSSKHFTNSNIFTKSNIFTHSNIFTQSNSFTNSNSFTKSNSFTNSNIFTNSNAFTQSNSFTLSSTKPFTFSIIFTKSDHFTYSNDFTLSNDFSDSLPFLSDIDISNGKNNKLYFIILIVGIIIIILIIIIIIIIIFKRRNQNEKYSALIDQSLNNSEI